MMELLLMCTVSTLYKLAKTKDGAKKIEIFLVYFEKRLEI